jgi:hypothetical protein
MSGYEHRPSIVRSCLDTRSELARLLTDPDYLLGPIAQWCAWMVPGWQGRTGADKKLAIMEIARKWYLSLQVGEPYAISEDMMAVVQAAGRDLPDEYIAEHHHLHAEHGFVWLPRPLHEPEESANAIPDVDALTWHHGQGTTRRWQDEDGNWQDFGPERQVPGIEVNLWARSRHLPTAMGYGTEFEWYPVGSDFLPYGMPSLGWRMHGYVGDGEIGLPEHSLSSTSRFVLALQMLMRQELPALNRWLIPRSQVRTLRRQHLPLNPVTVVDLRRREARHHENAPEPSGRHLTHRHLVRGHWRRYWVGPDHEQHPGNGPDKVAIWLYVAPFIKGPEGTPLVISEKVNVVRR